jgi:glycosyltransferase involved in cell wall biosynthesis
MIKYTISLKMNKILFDGTATQSSSRAAFHGGGEYAKYILRSAIEFGYEFDVVFGNWLLTDPNIESILSMHPQIQVYQVNEKKELYQLIERNGYERFYSALPAAYSDYSGPALLIGVIHGLRGAELPWDYFRYKYETVWVNRLQGWLISNCKPIQKYLKKKHINQSHRLLNVPNAQFIAVSNHTKNALLAFYPELQPINIQVFYSPFSVRRIDACEDKGDYFLMVSANRFEKNIYRALRVFDKLFSDNRLEGRRVVVTGCGKEPFWKEIKNQDRFELLPYVDTEELENLYEHAFCFVYPSLNEGFGYPPLKAMAYGTPVIASSATSIPEVCDDAACYFSPTNEDDLAARILRIYYDDDYRSHLVNRGIMRVKELQERQSREMEKILKMIFM